MVIILNLTILVTYEIINYITYDALQTLLSLLRNWFEAIEGNSY